MGYKPPEIRESHLMKPIHTHKHNTSNINIKNRLQSANSNRTTNFNNMSRITTQTKGNNMFNVKSVPTQITQMGNINNSNIDFNKRDKCKFF